MFLHTVLIRFRRTVDEDFFASFAAFETAVRSLCPGLSFYRLVPNIAPTNKGFGHVLFSGFESHEAFLEYDRSELHIELKAFLGPHVEDLVVADGLHVDIARPG